MSVRTLFIDRRPRGRCRLLRTRARPVHFRDVRRPRPVGSSPGSLRVPFVCSLLACWPCGRPCCSFRRGIRPWASKPYARLRRSVPGVAAISAGVSVTVISTPSSLASQLRYHTNPCSLAMGSRWDVVWRSLRKWQPCRDDSIACGYRGPSRTRFHPTRLETRTEESSAYASRGRYTNPSGVSESEKRYGGTLPPKEGWSHSAGTLQLLGAPGAYALGPERW